MLANNKDLVRLSTYVVLFLLQVLFIIFPIFNFWIKAFLLSSFMLFSTFIWIRIFEKRAIRVELGLDENGVTLLTYMFLGVILFFFTHNSFMEATMLTGGSLVVPVFEELFFRKYLLGSMVEGLPRIRDLSRVERIRFFKHAFLPLVATSLMFALVHDDVVTALLGFHIIDFNLLAIIVLRSVFGIAVGGFYLLKRNWILPAIFHVVFNLSYFLLH